MSMSDYCCDSSTLGVRITGSLGDIDPLNEVPLKRARSRVQRGSPSYPGPIGEFPNIGDPNTVP